MSFLRKMEKRKAMKKSSEKAATESTTTEGKIYIRLHFFLVSNIILDLFKGALLKQ